MEKPDKSFVFKPYESDSLDRLQNEEATQTGCENGHYPIFQWYEKTKTTHLKKANQVSQRILNSI